MSDYKEQANSLREHADLIETSIELYGPSATRLLVYDLRNAAAAIEELQARLGEAENSVERWKDMYLTKHEPKRGEWQKAKPKGVVTYSDGYAECSHCHETIWLGWWMNFCPHCGTQNKIIDPDDYDGAKMEVQE